MSDDDTVGTLLASIAASLADALRVFTFADKRQWGPDEEDQLHALEEALDDAKKDFQEMGPLVNGQFYYENDRRRESLDELGDLRTRFAQHAQVFKDWARAGGPVNPLWVRQTSHLKVELHRAQCRAARRIFNTEQEPGARCLGAFLVLREQRQLEREPEDPSRRQQQEQQQQQQQQQQLLLQQDQQPDQQQLQEQPPQQQQQEEPERADSRASRQQSHSPLVPASQRASLESLVPTCNAVGKFQRFGDRDIAFACDFCDGYIVWENVRSMPAMRTPLPPGDTQPNWQARAPSASTEDDSHRTIVFAPLAIANHQPPPMGDWLAPLTCPYCEQYTYLDQGDDGEEELRYVQDESGFPDLRSFQEHLEWHHTSLPVPALPVATPKCTVM